MNFPKVIIIGGGFAGLNAAKKLKNAPVDLLLIDRANHHLFQPLLYQVATSALSVGDIALPIREILAKQKNATVLLEDIVAIDKENKKVKALNGDAYPFDYLIIATGATHAYFGHPEWEEFAPGLKTLSDAITIREKVLLSYERAERCADPKEALKFMQFVIVGGGPTGVEMAGAIAEMAHKTLVGNFRRIHPEQTKIYLIEGLGQLLPAFPLSLAEKAKKDLEAMGVDVLLNSKVTEITQEGVWLGDKLIDAPTVIWAAGNEASSLLQTLNTPLDKQKRAIVQKDLSIPGAPDIFVLGDAACCYDEKGNPLPGIAPVAIQQGHYIAKHIRERIAGQKEQKPFSYFDKGMMATIGRAKAIATVGKFKISGFLAWLAWGLIHIFYLVSFPNRLLVMLQWFFLYLFNQRRVRLIILPSEKEEKESINRE